METYEIQIQLKHESSLWASLNNEANDPVYVYFSKEEAETQLEKVQNEYFPNHCRIVKRD